MSTVRLSGIILASVLALTTACGSKKKPITPDETASTDGGTDLPPSGDDAGSSETASTTDGGASSSPTPEKKAPPALALPAASAKITVKKKAIEVKSDGSVMIGGKAAGKLSGADMQDADGKTQYSVAADGSVTSGDGTNVGSFSGDDLTLTTGEKYAMGDDGTLTITPSGGGKAANAGKASGVGPAKRAVVLAAFVANKPEAKPTATPTKPKPKPKK